MSVTQARTPQSHPHLKWFRLQANIPVNGQVVPVNYPHILWATERQANETFWVSAVDTRSGAWYGRPCSDANRAPLRVWQWVQINRL